MAITLGELAGLVGAELSEGENLVITGIAGIKEAGEGDITFLANPRYAALIDDTRASAVIVSRVIEKAAKPLMRVDNPSLAFSRVAAILRGTEGKRPCGVHPKALIAAGVTLGAGVAVGAGTIIEEGVVVGDNTVIYGNCYIGYDAKIGENCLIYPQVCLRELVEVGSRVIIHGGAVLGSDGFGFVTVEGKHEKIPQVGTVVVEDDVEIGANVTIDRARFARTTIGQGTKIDNLVQIAHNVVTGKNCLLVAQAGIAGSTVLGDSVTLAGQVGVVGHIKIGNNVIVAAQSGVSKSVGDGEVLFGSPAKPMGEAKRTLAMIARLPQLNARIKELEKRIQELEDKHKHA